MAQFVPRDCLELVSKTAALSQSQRNRPVATDLKDLEQLLESKRLINYCRSMLIKMRIPHSDCEDVIAEAILVACNSLRLGQFKAESSLGSWFIGIVRKRGFRYFRSQRRADSYNQQLTRYETTEDPELRMYLKRIIDELPTSEREVVNLSFQGFSTKDIAGILKRSPGRTGALLAQGKRRLRKLIKQ